MKSKTLQAKEAFLSGDVKEALKIASTFKIGLIKGEMTVLKRGYEAIVHPAFYKQLGKDPEALIKEASELFVVKFCS